MPSAKGAPKPATALKNKNNEKLNGKGKIKKQKKKRKHKKVHATFSYVLLPKKKRLAKKVITRLGKENEQFIIAEGLDAITRLGKEGDGVHNAVPIPQDEKNWRGSKKKTAEHKRWRDMKIMKIRNRELARRERFQERRQKELRRKKYRLHPQDMQHKYIPGYEKDRHRISKARFLKCVDILLFKDVFEANKELQESPLFQEKLHLQNLSMDKAKQLRKHLYEFDVIVEALKQGIFDMPGCDDLPIHKIRRKRKKPEDSEIKPPTKSKVPKFRKEEKSELKRRMSFPPFQVSKEVLVEEEDEKEIKQKFKVKHIHKHIMSRVGKWFGGQKPLNSKRSMASVLVVNTQENEEGESVEPASSTTMLATESESVREFDKIDENVDDKVEDASYSETRHKAKGFHWAKKKSLVNLVESQTVLNPNEQAEPEVYDENLENSKNPFGDQLTMNVPTDMLNQKRFIRALAEGKNPKSSKQTEKSMHDSVKHAVDEARQRHERFEKTDPMQRLHPDERDSDIWTKSSSTSTNGYASWRRPRALRNAGNKQDVLAHKVDTSIAWRVLLLLIVLWEIGCFVKRKLDDVYYWILSSHLYRENIWLFEPTLFPAVEKYQVISVQEWLHFLVSFVSVAIIHRENECVSLLFAFSQLIDSLMDVGISIHDYVYLPEPPNWIALFLSIGHIIWKAFIICLFVAYHYYCAGYIRKAREFRHRKTKLHNHEIKVKGTKGIQKRRMAWSWMIRHARNTNLRHLKQKFPNVHDGNFPEDDLAKEIKFSEAKELRIYAQKHGLNIGYPYNKLRDIRRYVFGRLEKSDYDTQDFEEEKALEAKKEKLRRFYRRSSRAITFSKWDTWKLDEEAHKEHLKRVRTGSLTHKPRLSKSSRLSASELSRKGSTAHQPGHDNDDTHGTQAKDLTLSPAFLHRTLQHTIYDEKRPLS